MDHLDAFMHDQFEPLQYAAFFGTLVVLGLIELVASQNTGSPERSRRWTVNFGLTALNIAVLGALPLSGILVADYAREHGLGLMNIVEVAPLAALAIGFLLRSFISWLIHLSMHKVPVLWRIHRVHHSDIFVDISTTVRFHPLEFLISMPVLLLCTVALGIPPIALLLYELFDAMMAVFTHANIRLPRSIARRLAWVLVTPAMHRIHHSSWQPETDSNYGATFSIWDRMFGTYRGTPADDFRSMELGLAEYRDRKSQSLIMLLILPFLANRQRERIVGEGGGS